MQISEYDYTLYGVFIHAGVSTESGHYEVFLKNDDEWFEFNDDNVNVVSFDEVSRRSFGGKYSTNYFDFKSFELKER